MNVELMFRRFLVLFVLLLDAHVGAAQYPVPTEGDFVLKDFRFMSGEILPELRVHYRTLGRPERDAQGVVTNAVLILHGTTGSGAQFIRPEFAGELFRAGGLLDSARHFIILPDGIGHGQTSKPSDGLRARFPRYGYLDMVEAQYRLLTAGLGVNHLRLVMGTSMGGMHTWLWGERHPDFMDALMPLASLPTQISGRNRIWRRILIDAIRTDPEWRGGNYSAEPPSLRTAVALTYLMSSNPVLRQQELPTLAKSDGVFDVEMANAVRAADANDVLYQLEASRDYDPGPSLEKIRAPLVAVNSADDLINPPELGILEREIKRVSKGRAVVVPASPQTRGHGTHTIAAVWKGYLAELLADSFSSRGVHQDWARADLATTRLTPATFTNLPLAVRRNLKERGCTIPQSFATTRAGNVIRGRFTSAARTDWAVLCSVDRVSSILVFRGGSVLSVAELARYPDSTFLQVIGENGAVGYSRAIRVAGAKYIREHNRDDPSLPRFDHEGIDDAFVEKASSIWYWHSGSWRKLSGAD
jgi:homoserine O-acetyltransferase